MHGHAPNPYQPQRPKSTIGTIGIIPGLIVLALGVLVSCGAGVALGGGTTAAPRPTLTVVRTVTAKPRAVAPRPAAPKPTTVRLPSLVGSNGAIAAARLKALGITRIEYASGDPTASVVLLPANWRVTRMEPRAGTRVRRAPTTTVVLTLRKISG